MNVKLTDQQVEFLTAESTKFFDIDERVETIVDTNRTGGNRYRFNGEHFSTSFEVIWDAVADRAYLRCEIESGKESDGCYFSSFVRSYQRDDGSWGINFPLKITNFSSTVFKYLCKTIDSYDIDLFEIDYETINGRELTKFYESNVTLLAPLILRKISEYDVETSRIILDHNAFSETNFVIPPDSPLLKLFAGYYTTRSFDEEDGDLKIFTHIMSEEQFYNVYSRLLEHIGKHDTLDGFGEYKTDQTHIPGM